MTSVAEDEKAEVVLRDGSTVSVRPLVRDDEAALTEFLAGLSVRSRAFRFFSAGVRPEVAARRSVEIDYHDSYALVATSAGKIVGHAMYARSHPNAVEVAFTVADELHGRGLGTVLLLQMAAVASANGFEILEAEVLPENHKMLEVF